MVEDFSTSKFKPKNKDNVTIEIEEVQKETDMLLETLRNFKDTHSEMSLVIEEVMKI